LSRAALQFLVLTSALDAKPVSTRIKFERRLSLENAINFFEAGHGNLSLHLPSLPEMLRR
jgi:hypothetical protein